MVEKEEIADTISRRENTPHEEQLDNKEAISVAEQYFAELPVNHYEDGITIFQDHWKDN